MLIDYKHNEFYLSHTAVYGITTGFGKFARVLIDKDKLV